MKLLLKIVALSLCTLLYHTSIAQVSIGGRLGVNQGGIVDSESQKMGKLGGVGAIYGSPIQGIGNAIAFGDEYSLQRWGTDIIGGALIGGVVSGAVAGFKGQNLWWGNTVRPTATPPGNIEFPDDYGRFKGTNSKGQRASVGVDDPLPYANEHIKGLNRVKQLQHIPGEHYVDGKSILLSDPDRMLNEVYSLKYEFVRYNNAGHAVVKFNHPVGFYIQKGVNKGITNLATIHARSNGLIHFVPAWPLPY